MSYPCIDTSHGQFSWFLGMPYTGHHSHIQNKYKSMGSRGCHSAGSWGWSHYYSPRWCRMSLALHIWGFCTGHSYRRLRWWKCSFRFPWWGANFEFCYSRWGQISLLLTSWYSLPLYTKYYWFRRNILVRWHNYHFRVSFQKLQSDWFWRKSLRNSSLWPHWSLSGICCSPGWPGWSTLL